MCIWAFSLRSGFGYPGTFLVVFGQWRQVSGCLASARIKSSSLASFVECTTVLMHFTFTCVCARVRMGVFVVCACVHINWTFSWDKHVRDKHVQHQFEIQNMFKCLNASHLFCYSFLRFHKNQILISLLNHLFTWLHSWLFLPPFWLYLSRSGVSIAYFNFSGMLNRNLYLIERYDV